jgi:hypothetical protein
MKGFHAMKKTLVLLALLALSVSVAAADTLTNADGAALSASDWVDLGPGEQVYVLTMIYTDTDGNGTTGIDIPIISGTGVQANRFQAGYIEMATTVPDDTDAPTALYDIKIIKKTSGVDVFQGGLQNRSATDAETAWPLRGFEHPDDTLQLVVENQAVAGAVVMITLYVVR